MAAREQRSQLQSVKKLPPLTSLLFPPRHHLAGGPASKTGWLNATAQERRGADTCPLCRGQRRRGMSLSRPCAGTSSRPPEGHKEKRAEVFTGDAAVSYGNTDWPSWCLRDFLLGFLC